MLLRGFTLAFVAALSGCAKHLPASDQELAIAEKFIREDQTPLSPKILALWHANANASSVGCGEIEPPAALNGKRPSLRFYYDFTAGYGQVEYHELWVGDLVGNASLSVNRTLFDKLWDTGCAPYAPLARRIAWLL
ncbi:hypothetical protein [Sphingomonas crocodyli]|uniref:Lipoprotein n=1 Tax=Sphingomonas crocodyli TaxID=1979270 RepID=A0A437LUR7_9SPHN|nr:hypothetical protein [Sphingomonas crocodyli]RVT89129.1 hypothetical protein EOD43_22685 [Sphingomonas crocodyli]